ncbi:UPF0158 family protein [Pseudanabaena sp. 'Roaring Creek']|uniref:UPF0158 family protein n=1 Tax=Pseudanabaena sp. 'Roaring Creek' TaxID=1681830 RepID=UPI0006D7C327|nr:UPF0158 family protein [Pseudanabaena sp. 'Roaring Creek']
MSTAISKENISRIAEVMNSRDNDGLYGCIERETGEVLIGSQDYPLDVFPNEENENYEEAEVEFNLRYLQIPQKGSGAGYQDMEDFIETVEDKRLRDLLGVAIQGQGAFGRFKNVLRRSEYELEHKLWLAFSEKCTYDQVIEWLTSNGFSLEA